MPFSTLVHGHLALAFPSFLKTEPQILWHWGYAHDDHLGKIIPSDGILVSNVSMTYDGFSELNTSDWFPYV